MWDARTGETIAQLDPMVDGLDPHNMNDVRKQARLWIKNYNEARRSITPAEEPEIVGRALEKELDSVDGGADRDREKILKGVHAIIGERMTFDEIIDLSFGTCVGCGKKTGGFRMVNGQRKYICRDCLVKDWFPEEFGETDIPWR
jgi:hypothetical protein